MTAESEIMLLVNSVEKIEDEEGRSIKLEPPVTRWKKFIGDKDPNEARSSEPESLRALFG